MGVPLEKKGQVGFGQCGVLDAVHQPDHGLGAVLSSHHVARAAQAGPALGHQGLGQLVEVGVVHEAGLGIRVRLPHQLDRCGRHLLPSFLVNQLPHLFGGDNLVSSNRRVVSMPNVCRLQMTPCVERNIYLGFGFFSAK